MADSPERDGTANQDAITVDDLFDALAAGSRALRGIELIPEGEGDPGWQQLPPINTEQFKRGNVYPTLSHVPGSKTERWIQLARQFRNL